MDLEEDLKLSYRSTIRAYLFWCRENGQVATNESARSFMRWLERREPPSDPKHEESKDALRWFFRNGERKTFRQWAGKRQDWLERELEREQPTAISELETEWEEKLVCTIRRKGMALATERAYLHWCRRFAGKMQLEDPLQASESQVVDFLDYLASELNVAPSTQKQALNAIVFMLKAVAQRTSIELGHFVKARGRKRMPVVLDRKELQMLFAELKGSHRLMAQLQYGAGLRVTELLRLRIKDVDFSRGQVIVRAGKGDKDRIAPLPNKLEADLGKHVQNVKSIFEGDRRKGLAGTFLPGGLERKYPNAGKEWAWQWFWPSRETSTDPRSGIHRRHHFLTRQYQNAIRQAALRVGFSKRVTSHSLRHSFATHLLESGTDIRTVQDLLGHAQVETTMVYLHIMKKPGAGSLSPLDGL